MSTLAADAGLTRRLMKYIGAHPRLLVTSLLLYPLNAACVVLPPYILQQILDRAISTRDTTLLTWLSIGYFGALVLEYASGFASEFFMSVLGQRAMRIMRTDLFLHVQKLPTAFFDRNPIGRILTRLTNDVEALSEMFSSGAISIVSDVLTVAGVVSMMLWLDVKFTLFAFLVVPPLVGLAVFFQRFARQAFRDIRLHIARINTYLAEHIGAMSVVQVFGQEARTEAEFAQLNADYRDANRRAILVDASLFAVVEAIGTTAMAALIWYGAADLSRGRVSAGVLVAFIQYIRRFFVPIRDLSTKYTVLQSAYAAAERTFGLLDEPVTLNDAPDAVNVQKLEHAIAFDQVWFSYRDNPTDDKQWVLRDINLTVKRGERVALVGSTGSGKTTLLKLLNRSYDVQKGGVLVDGIDTRKLTMQSLRRLFAVVLQDVHLFSGTLMQNLTFADRVDQEAAKRAIHTVHADGLIARLPGGYDAPVQELGANFSAGERQLLALARALALDPQILILDEATSNIDSETEAHIQGALDALLAGRTAVVVAHRLSTIQKVDRIIVMQHGRIVQQGNHKELMQQEGVYKTLVELQFHEPEEKTA